MIGLWRALASTVRTPAQRSRVAALASSSICWRSAANERTTRTPLMFSSTMVDTSATLACTIHDRGKTWSRNRLPRR